MAPRIGLINIGHPDYPNDVGARFATQAADALRGREIVVVTDGDACTDPIAAMRRGQDMLAERLDGVIVWLGTWIEASTAMAAIREFEHLPFAVWGFPMYENEGRQEFSMGSFVAACVLKGALDRMGYPSKSRGGCPMTRRHSGAPRPICRAAHAAGRLKRTRLGLVGYASMSMYPGTFDHVLLRRIVGPEVVQFDTYTLVRLAEAVGLADTKEILDAWRAAAQVDVADERLVKAARLAVAIRTLVDKHRLHGLTVKCQYELSQEWGMTPCVPLSWLADLGVITSCEGDVMVAATQCLLAYLSNETTTYADILDLQGDTMLLSACGFAPFNLAHQPDSGPAVRICELDYPGFDGIISSWYAAARDGRPSRAWRRAGETTASSTAPARELTPTCARGGSLHCG